MNEIGSLDELVDRLSESYNLSSDRVNQIKSGLETTIVEYLKKELSTSSESAEVIVESIKDITSVQVLEKIVNSNTSVIKLNESGLVKFNRSSSGYTYSLLEGVDISKIDPQVLIECWDCDEDGVSKLLKSLEKAVC